ncbi:MAG: ribonuclease P protein component [Acidimicrobiia bacterium]|nr:ribonuclease P protein component [Acidimicrobiia bacterium]
MFAEFARVRPRRDGPLWVRRIALPRGSTPQVAFAIGRKVGNAVTRNRLRRRLRALLQSHAGELQDSSAYLIGVDPRAVDASSEDLDRSLVTCLLGVR